MQSKQASSHSNRSTTTQAQFLEN